MKIVFIGTPEFGAIVLEELAKTEYKPVLVVTSSDKPVGRKQILTPSPVKLMAQKYGIKIDQLQKIRSYKPDLIVVAAYGQIIPKEVLTIPKYGCLNIHPSLLPKYRGPSPIQYAILNGDEETGATIMLIDEKMDHGPIIANSKKQITNNKITSEELSKELARLGANILIETIPEWVRGKIKPKTQNESQATYTKILKREDGKIDWRKTPVEIGRQIRAFTPWPGTYTIYHGKKLKILKAESLNKKLIIKEVQLEGKKPMSFKAFQRGHPDYVIPQ